MIGDFSIRAGTDTGISIESDHLLSFSIIEAKINAPLAKGITNNKDYNQLARNVACLAYELYLNNISLDQIDKVSVLVLAPEVKITSIKKDNSFLEYKEKSNILHVVKNRINDFKGLPEYKNMDRFYNQYVIQLLHSNKLDVHILSWEYVFEGIQDEAVKREIQAYYHKTLLHNNIK